MIREMIAVSISGHFAGITVPLVITKSGEKLGKSSGNAVWLDKGMTTPDSLGQYINELSQDDTRRLALQIMDHSADNLQVSRYHYHQTQSPPSAILTPLPFPLRHTG